ncbi:MAG: hypothetical protein AAFR79_15910, partial [Pseudomonadota bacterium]
VFGAPKTERVHRPRFRKRREARAALFLAPRAPLRDDIEIFYNGQRRHSSIGCRKPQQARIDMTIRPAA